MPDLAQSAFDWLFEGASDPLARVDSAGRVVAVNGAWRAALTEPTLPLRLSQLGPELEATELVPGSAAPAIGRLRIDGSVWRLAAHPHGEGHVLRATHDGALETIDYLCIVDDFPTAIALQRGGHIAYVNKKAVALMGYDSADALHGLPIERVVHSSELDRLRERAAEIAAAGTPLRERETRLLRNDGSFALAELSGFRARLSGGVGCAFVVRDVTERRRLEAQIRHGRRMEAIGRLAGGIAHDFNNHLSVILNCAEFLAASLPKETSGHHDAEEIRCAAQRAAGLTKQLLTFSRGDVGEPELLDINDVVRRLSEFLRRIIGADIDLDTQLMRELPAIRAVRQHLEQILVNLTVNARDATPSGGKVRIVTSYKRLSGGEDAGALPAGRYVVVEVHDNGEGMSPEVASRAFEPFFTTKSAGKGTGLGLSTVHGIVCQVGGQVSLQSEQGRGTVVRILWPAVADRVLTSDDDQATDASDPEVVLLVEDDAAVRAMVARMLKRLGFEVIEAINALEALTLMEDGQLELDVVVTDVVMPRMTGPELVAVLHEADPDIPVVFMSGYADEVLEDHVLEPLHVTFLPKPFTSKELKDKIEQARSPAEASV